MEYVLATLVLVIYFLPVIVAYWRDHHRIRTITLVSVFLGWTVIGFLVALIWSLGTVRPESRSD